MSKNRKADNILQALLAHRTIKEAAAAARVSERVIYDYLKDPAFDARYKAARDDIIRGVSNHLREQMNEAVDIIGAIMRNKKNKPNDRLAAAKSILELGDKYTISNNILERMENLEQALDDIE
ncbi:MAG: hypothetical protein LBH43_07275 [Treponema sp.]|jgi:hypothetical protein|nr:hypothetical protein [Treponema sp.]